MKTKIVLTSLISISMIFLCGLCYKEISAHCISINARKSMFYGLFAKNISSEMEKKGYNFSCPAFLPKTIIDFSYTDDVYLPQLTDKRDKDISMILVGDCPGDFDKHIEKYDYVLSVDELRFGNLAMFNYKSVHFPIVKNRNIHQYLCNTRYDNYDINIKETATYLDDIIQRAWNEKM